MKIMFVMNIMNIIKITFVMNVMKVTHYSDNKRGSVKEPFFFMQGKTCPVL